MDNTVKDQAEHLRRLVNRKSEDVKVITVASGKGGVGKTSFTVNLAIALGSLGKRVLVIDADFGMANIDVMLGVSAKYNISHVLRGEKSISDIIQDGHLGIRFISGGSGVYELLQMDENKLREIMRELLDLEGIADIILFDAGAGINDGIMQLILSSSETVVLATPEPTSILDAYALIKTIVNTDGDQTIRLVMNKCETKKEAESAIAGFQKVILKHLGKQLDSLGHILDDSEIPRSIKQMTPLLISTPNSPAARDIKEIAERLVDIPGNRAPKGFFAKLFLRFKD